MEKRLKSGDELGASVTVIERGEVVVDLWGGFADAAKTRPWQQGTLVNVFSTTKTMVALSALLLADRGELDLDAPVARYWPEFAANGKEGVLIRHILSHASGVSGWEKPVVMEDVYDWDKSTSRLAAQAPWWEPGTASGYHALSFGHLVGEVIHRITGQRLPAFFAEQIAGPLDVDFTIGLPEDREHRAAEVVPTAMRISTQMPPADSVAVKTLTGPIIDTAVSNTTGWKRADIGAANGYGNAKSVALAQAVISHGGEHSSGRLLSGKTIERIFETQTDDVDLVIGRRLRWGIGYCLSREELKPIVGDNKIAFWGGKGGSQIINDLDRGVTFSYMMNKLQPDLVGSENSRAYLGEVYAER
ncbi:serine hydrolase domain-containing protein [Streptomyces sp. CA-100214]